MVAFNRLEIKNAFIKFSQIILQDEQGEWVSHRINKITFRGNDGIVYSYMMDIGFFPLAIFPFSESAIKLRKNKADIPKFNSEG